MSIFIQQLPFCGKVTRCTDRGFGYIDGPYGEQWVHLRDHVGRRLSSMMGVEGQTCAFVIGGHALRYTQNKANWDSSVIQWRILDNVAPPPTPQEYLEERKRALFALDDDQLKSVLSADWYFSLWKDKTDLKPKTALRQDPILTEVLESRLAQAGGAEELVDLLANICSSPWFGVTPEQRKLLYRKFFQPLNWPARVFQTKRSISSHQNFKDIPLQFREEIADHIRKVKTISVDLESDGDTIYQFGWKNAAGEELRSSKTGLSRDELLGAFKDCIRDQTSPCIVGHNLLAWDLPILDRQKIVFPSSSTFWDTLIASWILEPWRASHALIVGENAHQADADAKVCFELFEKQTVSLEPCLQGFEFDIQDLVDRIFDAPALLSRIQGREYPNNLQKNLKVTSVFPSGRAYELAWQKGFHLELVAPENRLTDPTLSPEICRKAAEEQNSISAKTVAIIVSDADLNGVEIRLSNLPQWLANDEFRLILKDAHLNREVAEGRAYANTVYLAEDLFKLDDCDIHQRISSEQISVVYPNDVAMEWQRSKSRVLTEAEAREIFPDAMEGHSGRALFPVLNKSGSASWLFYEPLGMNENGASWSLLSPIPGWLQTSSNFSQDFPDADNWVRLPRYRDGATSKLDADHLFVSPNTANRPLYLSDLTHGILNILRARSGDEVLLIGIRWPKEANQIQQNLIQLALSSEHPGTPLRRLESVHHKGLKALACNTKEIPKFVKAANDLGVNLQIVLDEVPLHDWHALLNTPESVSLKDSSDQNADFPDNASEDHENLFDADESQRDDFKHQPVLQRADILAAASAFLGDWMRQVLGGAGEPPMPCLVLDPRLTDLSIAKALELSQQDVPFYTLEELLDDSLLEVFYKICFPARDELKIPSDYDSYKSFLLQNWGYEDFRPGTQKPAIETMLDNDRDILLRLPTGAGKSIVFHLPALLRSHYSRRLTIVVTPLRALMRDQVEGLWRKHFTETVDYLSGGRDAWINYEVYQGILDGRIQMVFIAPERFRVPRFVEVLERRRRMDGGLEFIVFDETHCISEWGFEFRPDYLYAAQSIAKWFKEENLPGNPHRLLLTSATVTQRNRIDLEKELRLGAIEPYEVLPKDMPHPIQPFIVLESFDLIEDEGAPTDEKFEKIVEILKGLALDDSAALIFVRRRKDCHRLSEALNTYAAQANSGLASVHALPFHAGLPEAVKTEACDLLNDRKANVLVSTKAFGMGMDIPHVHACIHHRPPTFIEDYLQEVGRVGRDEDERMRTGHERVTATLLYNQDDIERNLGQLHDNTLTPPDLQDFFNFCLTNSVAIEKNEKALCIVPTAVRVSETKAFDENQVSSCLFWLERMSVLKVEGRHPPFLNLNLNMRKLRAFAGESSLASRIAKHVLDIVEESHSIVSQLEVTTRTSNPQTGSKSIFGRVIKGLLRGVIALISSSEKIHTDQPVKSIRAHPIQTEQKVDVSISTSELMSGGGGISMDDLFAGLIDLNKADVLEVRKNFVISTNGVPSGDEFWELLQIAVDRLLQPTEGKVELLPRKEFETELRVWYYEFLSSSTTGGASVSTDGERSKLLTRRVQREVYRAISTSIRMLRYAGVGLRESLSESGEALYARAIPDITRSSVSMSVNESIRTMRSLLDCVSSHEKQSHQSQDAVIEIPLTAILNSLGDGIRISKLKELMKLLESAGFYGFEGTLSGWESLVSLNARSSIPSHNPDAVEGSLIQRTYTEMLEKYEFQVLRAQAMVLLAAMQAENRRNYIDRYFDCVERGDLEKLLEDTVGDVDEEVLNSNPLLQELLSQVRQERFSEEIEKLNEDQLGVCKAPFDHTLLVNAGPGSGKTHVLMMRCAHLIHEQRIDPAAILVLAFNRAVVYEIRDRIRSMFKALGYGRYANRLDVTTFHSFALRHQRTTDLYEEDAIGQAVHSFAKKMENDDEFARVIGGRYKAVLVDEFQDMNEDFYKVVMNLLTNCSGGGMVIGDDDQDILTWNRRNWGRIHRQTCPLDAAHYFSALSETLEPDQHKLTINYRSVPEVVERANGMIQKVSNRAGFSRMKSEVQLSAFRESQTDVGQNAVEMPFSSSECHQITQDALSNGESVAILCRSNRECRQVYEKLVSSDTLRANSIDLLGSEDFSLYQFRHSGALLDICSSRNDYDFVEKYIWEDLVEEFERGGFADIERARHDLNLLYSLVREEVGRPRIRDLQAFIMEMRASDVERLKGKAGLVQETAKVTVATVHKVKGLEFDTVLVMPSSENFPFRISEARPAAIDAAEEARLYYVAMTRARNRLYIGWEQREKNWLQCAKFEAEDAGHRYFLKGTPKELFVSWPGQEQQVSRGLQEYIEKQVCLGDKLELRDRTLLHQGCAVGRLSTRTAERLHSTTGRPQVRVSNVLRYTCGRYFRERNPQFWEPLHDNVKNQGWFYIVLVEEG